MRIKNIKVILLIGFIVSFTNTVKAQPTLQQGKNPQSPAQTNRVEKIEDKMTQLNDKIVALEARERALTQAYLDHMNWFMGILTAFPVLAAIFLFYLRRSIIKELTEEAGNEINKNIRNINRRINKISTSLEEFITAREIDDLANKQLDLGLTKEEVKELKVLIKEAPQLTQDIVFYKTRDFLLEKLKEGKFEEVGKASAIFESIIESDRDNKFLRSRAYLSYILAYHDYPKYSKLEEASKLIDEAIRIRNRLKKDNSELYFYEFKRAIYNLHKVRIKHFPKGSKVYEEINKDLEDSRKYPTIDKIKEEVISGNNNVEFQKRYISPLDFEVLKKWWSNNQ